MNKKLKHIIAATLVISAFTAITPATSINFGVTKAYAASDTDIGEDKFKDLVVNKEDTSRDLQLYDDSDCKKNDETDFDYDDKKYYVKLSGSTDSVNIEADVDNGYEAYVFKDSRDRAYDLGKEIKVDSGTKLYVRIYEDGKFDEDDVKDNVERTYTIYIEGKSSSSSNDDEDDYDDDIYLDDIKLSEGDINFDEDKRSYDVKVAESVDSIKVTAEPEDEDYTVSIDDYIVDDDDDYERRVDLSKGKNVIKINVEDDDDNRRTYTVNVTREEAKTTNNNTNTNVKPNTNTNTTGPGSNVVANQWVSVNGKWQYNDASGKPIKSNWYSDRNSGAWYFLDSRGDMATGWLISGNSWYYLNNSGAMQTGWLLDGGNWYYLDKSGVMKTGWVIDNGSYYYLNNSGVMQANTTISGYKLGSNGAWIRR